jgi:hypothetical protein
VVINESDLRGSNAGILEFEGRALLTAEDDDVLAFDTDGTGSCKSSAISNPFNTESDGPMSDSISELLLGGRDECDLTSLHGLHGIFHLEDVPIGAGAGLDDTR